MRARLQLYCRAARPLPCGARQLRAQQTTDLTFARHVVNDVRSDDWHRLAQRLVERDDVSEDAFERALQLHAVVHSKRHRTAHSDLVRARHVFASVLFKSTQTHTKHKHTKHIHTA